MILKSLNKLDIKPKDWVREANSLLSLDLTHTASTLHIEAKKQNDQASHAFIYYKEDGPLTSSDRPVFSIDSGHSYRAAIKGFVTGNLQVQLVVIGFENKKHIFTEYIGLDFTKNLKIPQSTTDVKLVLRVSGEGSAELNEISLQKFNNSINDLDNAIANVMEQNDYLILSNVYPEKNNLYRNMFVHRRAELYKDYGINADIFRFSNNESSFSYYEFENLFVMNGGKRHLSELIKRKKYKKILIHFVNQEMFEAIEDSGEDIPIVIWIHGVETEKWYRRWFNFSKNSVELKRALGNIERNRQTLNFMKYVYECTHLDIKFVFVSKWFKEAVAECDTNTVVENYEIIHNVVDENLFEYQEKDIEQRKKILSIRPYASRKYANDLTVKAILELSQKPFFRDLEFNIFGEGPLFHEVLEPIKQFENVNIHNRFLAQNEIARLHKEHGVFMCPTRLDSQGVSMCEAMSSGLIPITNGVTAIPEFVNETCGYLAEKESHIDMVKAIEELYYNSSIFKQKSLNAATRMREQCGKQKVISEEIKVIKA